MDFSKLRPGSSEARAAGCICPTENNNHGKGLVMKMSGTQMGIGGSIMKRVIAFIIIEGCPIHWADNKTEVPIPEGIDPNKYYKVKEVAGIFQCSNSHIRDLIRKKKIAAIKIGSDKGVRILGATIIRIINNGMS